MKRLLLIVPLLLVLMPAFAQDTSLFIDLEAGKQTGDEAALQGISVSQLSPDKKLFSYTYTAPKDTDFRMKVALPADSRISQRDGLLISRPVFITTDGRQIYIEWATSLKEGEEFSAFVQYETGKVQEIPVAYAPLVVVVALIAGFLIGFRLKRFKKKRFVMGAVSEDEGIVLKELEKGEQMQDELRHKLGWTKTKVSKVVRRLEAKGIIEKRPYRKTNKLKIK